MGASAGGHLVALLGASNDDKSLEGDVGGNANQSSRVQAVCSWFGAFDFLNWGGPNKLPTDGMAVSALGKLLGGTVESKLDLAKQASPITYVSKTAPPFLLLHGDKDPLVPLQQSELMHEALKKAGADSTLHVVKGGGHGLGFNTPEVSKTCAEFFARTLKKE